MAKSIEATLEDVQAHKALTKAMGLIDLDVVKQEWDEAEEILLLYCIPRWGVDVCPECGHLVRRIHDYPEQRHVHDAPLRGIKTLLVFDVHRLRCECCQHVFTLRFRDIVADCTTPNDWPKKLVTLSANKMCKRCLVCTVSVIKRWRVFCSKQARRS